MRQNQSSKKHIRTVLTQTPLLPYPLKIADSPGRLAWPPPGGAFCFNQAPADIAVIRSSLASAGIPMTGAPRAAKNGHGVLIGRPGAAAERLPASNSPEAYRLAVTPRGVSLRAHSRQGLICGWQTFMQMLETSGDSLPCGIVDDAPALALRGFHLDLKGLKPKPAYLLELPKRLAAFKYNAILLELEDYIRFTKHPAIAHADALSPSFWKDFAERAQTHCIEIIPLLQTWGHLQYILRLPRYRHLAEAEVGMVGEICPLHPETWPLLRDMLDEICDVFPASRYLHIGLDEIFTRGKCPRCRRQTAAIGMNRFVIRMLNQRFDYLAQKGKIPMFWGSADGGKFSKNEIETIHNPLSIQAPQGSFTARAVAITGNYGMTGTFALSAAYAGGISVDDALKKESRLLEAFPFSSVSLRTIKDLPPKLRRDARRHVIDPRSGLLKPAFGLTILKEHGFDVIAISAAQYSAGVMGLCPDFTHRQGNEWAIAQEAKAKGCMGVIDTWWARGHSNVRNNAPLEAAWYGIASMADFSWRPAKRTSVSDFDDRWRRLFLGVKEAEATDALYVFSMGDRRQSFVARNITAAAHKMWQAAIKRVVRNKLFCETVDLGMEAHLLGLRLQFAQLEAEYLFATWDRIPNVFRKDCRNRLRALTADIRRFAIRIRRVLKPMMINADIEELVRAEVNLRLVQTGHIAALLSTKG